MAGRPHDFYVSALVSLRTFEPVVTIRFGDETGQMGPAEAREIARNLFEMAEAAESEARFVAFLRDGLKLDIEDAVKMLRGLRATRPPTHSRAIPPDETPKDDG